MALVKEASRDGYVADGSVRSGELTTSEFDAEMPNVVPDRQVAVFMEFPREMSRMHTDAFRSLFLHENVYGSKVRFMDLKGFADQSRPCQHFSAQVANGATCRIAEIWQRFVASAHVCGAAVRLRDD
jgi:hypothetical protein